MHDRSDLTRMVVQTEKGVERLAEVGQVDLYGTRFEKRAANYPAMVNLGIIMLWLQPLQRRPSRMSFPQARDRL
jgi:hypothetical protein